MSFMTVPPNVGPGDPFGCVHYVHHSKLSSSSNKLTDPLIFITWPVPIPPDKRHLWLSPLMLGRGTHLGVYIMCTTLSRHRHQTNWRILSLFGHGQFSRVCTISLQTLVHYNSVTPVVDFEGAETDAMLAFEILGPAVEMHDKQTNF